MVLIPILMCVIVGIVCYKKGEQNGATKLEREILHHVTESPQYEQAVVDSFQKAFKQKFSKRE